MYFYDPHPGFAGCTIPIPEEVRLVANELNGQEMELEIAIELIQKACPEGKVKTHLDFISLG